VSKQASKHNIYTRNVATANRSQVSFSASCNIYISRLYYDVVSVLSVRLSVTEVHWRITANLGFKFRSQFTAHCGRGACGRGGKESSRGRVEGSSRAMLATARPFCYKG